MEYNNSLKEKEVIIDLENDGTNSGDDVNVEHVSGNRGANRILSKSGYNESGKGASSGIGNGSGKESGEDGIEVLVDKDSGQSQMEEHLPLLGEKNGKDDRKSSNSKKASKPPRPPKGPSLYASDIKLVKEITELTMKKRARMERVKALKKMKPAKSSSQSSSSNSTLTAMVVTAVFCIVIILQGFSSRSSPPSVISDGSPEPVSEPKGLISVQTYKLSPNDHGSESPSPRAGEVHPPSFQSPG